ncbi:uncharacterized protein LOC135843912 [Planococcus citri]|uniref:uncharacterized protein LOC135843912 n=1 Tax=Planococcus citri TaxID=170843 RepID=UPI0031F961E5
MTSHNSYYKGRRPKERRKWARDSDTGTESDSSTSYSEDERSFRYTSQPARFEEGFDARKIINMKTDAGSEEEFDARDIINMNKVEEGFDARDIINMNKIAEGFDARDIINMNKAEAGFEEEFDARDIINMRTINRVTDREDSQQDDYETASEQWPSEDELSNLDESPKFVEGVQVGLKINLNVEETRRKVHKLQDMREDMWEDDNRRASEHWPGGNSSNIEPSYTYSHEQQPEPESNLDAFKKETNVANSLHVEAEAGDWEPKNRHKKVRFQDEKMDTDKDCFQKTNSRGDDDGIRSSERRPAVKRLGSRRKAFSATVPRKYAKWRSQSACHEPKGYRQRRRVFKLQKRSKPKREPICTNCWHPNHVVQNCMGSKRCDSCKKDGHATDLCWFRPGKRGRITSSSSKNVRDDLAGERDGETSKKCYVCKKTGHATNRCWFRLGERGRKPSSENVEDDLLGERDGETSKKCNICKKTGHATDRCWFRRRKRGRKTSSSSENVEDDLLDESGCETTLENVEYDLPGEGDCETTSENSEGDALYWYA